MLAMKATEVVQLLEDLLAGNGDQAELASRLLAARKEELDPEGLAAGVALLRSRAVQVAGCSDSLDVVGTGGGEFRRKGTVNISTLTAMFTAASGVAVCKQGNRKASSTSGSSDLLEALGIPIGLGPDEVAACLAQTNFGYCFAPRFHPGLGSVAPLRRSLGVATMFNWMAPLANPASPQYVLLGVHDPVLAELEAGTLLQLGVARAIVVCGPNGLDELSVVSPSTIYLVDGAAKTIERREIVPREEFGVQFDTEPIGGDTDWNVKLAEQVINGGASSPLRETIAANVALALYTRGVHADLRTAWQAAQSLLDKGIRDWFSTMVATHQRIAGV
jgi:anthranilate phosphoribosyltransferase